MEGVWHFTNRVRSTNRLLVWKSQFAGADVYMHAVANLWHPLWSPNSGFTTIKSYRLLPVGSRLVHNGCLSKDMGIPSEPSSTPSEYQLPPQSMTVFPPSMENRNSARPRYRDRIPSRDKEPIVKCCSRCNQKGHFRDKCTSAMPAPSSFPGSSSKRKKTQSRTTQEDQTSEDVFGTYDLVIKDIMRQLVVCFFVSTI